jgi:hypothetical protein
MPSRGSARRLAPERPGGHAAPGAVTPIAPSCSPRRPRWGCPQHWPWPYAQRRSRSECRRRPDGVRCASAVGGGRPAPDSTIAAPSGAHGLSRLRALSGLLRSRFRTHAIAAAARPEAAGIAKRFRGSVPRFVPRIGVPGGRLWRRKVPLSGRAAVSPCAPAARPEQASHSRRHSPKRARAGGGCDARISPIAEVRFALRRSRFLLTGTAALLKAIVERRRVARAQPLGARVVRTRAGRLGIPA